MNETSVSPQAAAERFPLDDLRLAETHLRRPFAPAAIKWKVQSQIGDKYLIVPYIDARLVIERLHVVVGPHWSDHLVLIESGMMICELTVCGTRRSDVGMGDGKGVASDAFKRAGVKFGIGMSMYAIPRQRFALNSQPAVLRESGRSTFVTYAGLDALARLYAKWLADEGTATFGPVLDHAKVEDDEAPPNVDPETGEIHEPARGMEYLPEKTRQAHDRRPPTLTGQRETRG